MTYAYSILLQATAFPLYMIRHHQNYNPGALTNLSSVSSSKPTFAKFASYTFLLSFRRKKTKNKTVYIYIYLLVLFQLIQPLYNNDNEIYCTTKQ